MKIAITTPAAADARNGNRHTAGRWAALLRSLGHRVSLGTQWTGGDADILIALHARKSAEAIEAFHRLRPEAPLIVVLTGTDLYRDIQTDAAARRSLELATRLVLLQPHGRGELAPEVRSKARVVFQSANPGVRRHAAKGRFRIAVIGHLRDEKDPFRAVMAVARLPELGKLEVVHIGDALVPGLAVEAGRWMAQEPRYRWLRGKTHGQTLRWLSRSDVLVVSSLMEGGANVICEAVRVGVPVLASRVSGNLGMLGGRYPGYFPLYDDRVLAQLIERAAGDTAFYGRLKRAALERRPLFTPAAERASLQRLLRGLN